MNVVDMNSIVMIDIENEDEVIRVQEKSGISLYELAEKYYKSKDGLKAIFALVNGEGRDLLYRIGKPCTVKFITLRERLARLTYQRTVFFIYLMAVNRILPDTSSVLRYPLNGGIYTQIKNISNLSKDLAYTIEKEMRNIIDANYVLQRQIIRRDEILSDNPPESADSDLINFVKNCDVQEVFDYSCEGYRARFYDPLLPCTGLIKCFEIVPYEEGIILRVPQFENPEGLPEYRDDVKLFEAFREISKWRKHIGVKYINDLNNRIVEGAYHDIMLVTEAFQEKKIADLAEEIIAKDRRIILIAGPSSSGKTTFAQRLCIQLRANGKKPLYMGTDDYFLERNQVPKDENGKFDFESLSAVDVELFNKHMNDLLEGKIVDMPVFDFITGSKRYGTRITHAEENQPIVIEGIHALNDELTKAIDDNYKFRIYISPLTALNIDGYNRIPVTDIRLLRRIARDIRSRGKTAKQTLNEWMSVRDGEIKNIFPYIHRADALFNSAFIYELSVIKPLVEHGLYEINRNDEEYIEAERLLRILRCVKPITDINTISNNSIIREFLGGGIWVK